MSKRLHIRRGGAVMHRFILVSLVCLFTLLTSEFIFLANQATAAGCCMCTNQCAWFCTCRGSIPSSPKCALPNDVALRHVSQPLPPLDSVTPGADRLRKLAIERQCPQNRSNFSLLEERFEFSEQAFDVTNLPLGQIGALETSP
jgi:hypothetical protein